jgi:hypothetical protein
MQVRSASMLFRYAADYHADLGVTHGLSLQYDILPVREQR